MLLAEDARSLCTANRKVLAGALYLYTHANRLQPS